MYRVCRVEFPHQSFPVGRSYGYSTCCGGSVDLGFFGCPTAAAGRLKYCTGFRFVVAIAEGMPTARVGRVGGWRWCHILFCSFVHQIDVRGLSIHQQFRRHSTFLHGLQKDFVLFVVGGTKFTVVAHLKTIGPKNQFDGFQIVAGTTAGTSCLGEDVAVLFIGVGRCFDGQPRPTTTTGTTTTGTTGTVVVVVSLFLGRVWVFGFVV